MDKTVMRIGDPDGIAAESVRSEYEVTIGNFALRAIYR
jgi:hypothetical protein